MRKKLPQKLLTGAVSVAIILTATLSPVFADALKKGTTTTVLSSDESIGEVITTQSDVLKAVSPRISTEAVTYTVGETDSDFPATAAGLQAAFATNSNNYIIKLMDNVDLGTTAIMHDKNETVTLDLNGHEVTYSGEYAGGSFEFAVILMEKDTNLVIDDSSKNKNGKLTSAKTNVIRNMTAKGNITINGGELHTYGDFSEKGIPAAINNYSKNIVTINGGIITTKGNGARAIDNEKGSVVINGGIISAEGYGGNVISHLSGGNLEINGGVINSFGTQSNVISVGSSSSSGPVGGSPVTINGGRIIATGRFSGALLILNGSLTINGGTISSYKNEMESIVVDAQSSDKIVADGGSFPSISVYNSGSKNQLKNSLGKTVRLCTLSGMKAEKEISNFSTVPTIVYGTSDVFTDINGNLSIWLPTENVTGTNTTDVSLKIGEIAYTGTIVNGNANMKSDEKFNVSVTGGTSDVSLAKAGDTVKITANVPSGKIFKEWKITPDVTFVNNTSKTSKIAQFTMPTSNINAVAVFTSTSTSTSGNYSGGGTSTYSNYTEYVVSGNGQIIEKNSGASAKFTIDMPYISFIYLQADKETLVNGTDYTVSDGSILINLNPAYLNTLSVGKHKVRAEITGGYAELSFEIVEKIDTPKPAVLPTTGTVASINPQTSDSWFSGLLF